MTTRPTPMTVIRPVRRWWSFGWRELWQRHELLYFLVWRDFKVRYTQTALGAVWVVLQPLLTMAVFTVIFSRVIHAGTDGTAYPLMIYCGLMPWQLFVRALTESGNSLVLNQHLLTKVYFPRLIMPMATVLGGVVDFGVVLLMMGGMMAWYGVPLLAEAVWIPILTLQALLAAMGVGLWLSVLNVRYRDIRHTVPFLTQFCFFVTPIAYPVSLVPERWLTWYYFNPLVAPIQGFRWALLGQPMDWPLFWLSTSVTLFLLVSGWIYFRRMELTLADIV